MPPHECIYQECGQEFDTIRERHEHRFEVHNDLQSKRILDRREEGEP